MNLTMENLFAATLALTIPGGIGGLAVYIVIIAAVVAVVLIACKAMGVVIPSWVTNVVWVLIIAAVCVWAIKFLMSL